MKRKYAQVHEKQAHTFLKTNRSLDRKDTNGKEKDYFPSFFLRLLEGKVHFFLNRCIKHQ